MRLATTTAALLILSAPTMAYSSGYSGSRSEPTNPQARTVCEVVNRHGCCMKPIPGTNAWQRAAANCGMPFTPDDPEQVPHSPPENDNGDEHDKPKDPPKDKPKDQPKDKPGCKCGQNPGNDKPVGNSPYDGEKGEEPSGKEKKSNDAR